MAGINMGMAAEQWLSPIASWHRVMHGTEGVLVGSQVGLVAGRVVSVSVRSSFGFKSVDKHHCSHGGCQIDHCCHWGGI
jgi:hypothetical protein